MLRSHKVRETYLLVTLHLASVDSSRCRAFGREDSTEDVGQPKRELLGAGRTPLSPDGNIPERIRINSRHILNFFKALSDQSELKVSLGSLVMLRPFRFLSYYENEIREKLRNLNLRFPGQRQVSQEGTSQDLKSTSKDPPDEFSGSQKATGVHTPTTAATSDKRSSRVDEESSDTDDGDDENRDPYTDSHEALRHLQCLVDFIDTHIHKRARFLASDRCTSVTLADVWYLFRPGDEVIEKSLQQSYKIIGVSNARHGTPKDDRVSVARDYTDGNAFLLSCIYIDFDGNHLGPVIKTFSITEFQGEKAIDSLEVFPLRYIKGGQGSVLRNKYIAQARTFLDVAAIKHMHYNGPTWNSKQDVDSQVVIDFKEALASSEGQHWMPDIKTLSGDSFPEDTPPDECICKRCMAMQGDKAFQDNDLEKIRSVDYLANLAPDQSESLPACKRPRPLPEPKSANDALSDEDLVLISHRVFGFVLRTRSWGK